MTQIEIKSTIVKIYSSNFVNFSVTQLKNWKLKIFSQYLSYQWNSNIYFFLFVLLKTWFTMNINNARNAARCFFSCAQKPQKPHPGAEPRRKRGIILLPLSNIFRFLDIPLAGVSAKKWEKKMLDVPHPPLKGRQ